MKSVEASKETGGATNVAKTLLWKNNVVDTVFSISLPPAPQAKAT